MKDKQQAGIYMNDPIGHTGKSDEATKTVDPYRNIFPCNTPTEIKVIVKELRRLKDLAHDGIYPKVIFTGNTSLEDIRKTAMDIKDGNLKEIYKSITNMLEGANLSNDVDMQTNQKKV